MTHERWKFVLGPPRHREWRALPHSRPTMTKWVLVRRGAYVRRAQPPPKPLARHIGAVRAECTVHTSRTAACTTDVGASARPARTSWQHVVLTTHATSNVASGADRRTTSAGRSSCGWRPRCVRGRAPVAARAPAIFRIADAPAGLEGVVMARNHGRAVPRLMARATVMYDRTG